MAAMRNLCVGCCSLEDLEFQIPPYLLTPWSRVLPEKLKSPELLKKFAAFYGT
jgi:hypothetical protein